MKRLALLVFLIPAVCMSAPYDVLLQQRNIADTATFTRVASLPQQNVSSLLGIDQFTNLPAFFTLDGPLGIINGKLMMSTVWSDILNRPNFAAVATSGDYNDLINKPSGSQVNADWTASSGAAEIFNKPALSAVATSGAYADLTGTPTIPPDQVQSDWNAVSAPAAILNKPVLFSGSYSALSDVPSTFAPSAHTQSFSTITSTPTTLSGYGITDGATIAQLATKFTTPAGTTAQYVRGDGSLATLPLPSTGTVTSVTAGDGLSGGTFTTSGTISMPNTGLPGSYSGVTTDSQGRVTSGTNRSQSSVTRSLNAAFQISTTRDADVRYSVQCTITASISGGQACDVILEIASDVGFTANVQTLGIIGAGQTYTLAVALQGVGPQTAQVTGYVPAGYYVRLRTVSVTGSPSYLYRAGQEILQ